MILSEVLIRILLMHNKLMSHSKLKKIKINKIINFRINKINRVTKMSKTMKIQKIICNNKCKKRKKLVLNQLLIHSTQFIQLSQTPLKILDLDVNKWTLIYTLTLTSRLKSELMQIHQSLSLKNLIFAGSIQQLLPIFYIE